MPRCVHDHPGPDQRAGAAHVRERGTQRTDSTQVLAAVRDLTRLELNVQRALQPVSDLYDLADRRNAGV